jgi:hypothetical protein
MSVDRKKRLAKLVKLENRLKAIHETRRAGHIADANRAAGDVAAVTARFDDPDSLSSLFPQLYHRSVERSLAAGQQANALAKEEESKIAAATIRTNRVAERYREASRVVDEDFAAKERQELVDRNAQAGKS